MNLVLEKTTLSLYEERRYISIREITDFLLLLYIYDASWFTFLALHTEHNMLEKIRNLILKQNQSADMRSF